MGSGEGWAITARKWAKGVHMYDIWGVLSTFFGLVLHSFNMNVGGVNVETTAPSGGITVAAPT